MNRNIQQLIADKRWQQWLVSRCGSLSGKAEISRLPVQGNQAEVYHCRLPAGELVFKCVFTKGLYSYLQRRFLKREWRAYQVLEGVQGVPTCYGLFDNQVLVLAFVKGRPYRAATFARRDQWFEQLDQLIQTMHQHGVSHGDIKRKANLIAGDDGCPWLLDFGISTILRSGWHPVNRWVFNYQCKTDINALLKHKYHGDYRKIAAADRHRLHYTWPEKIWRALRPVLGVK